jgi:hypothetical protein
VNDGKSYGEQSILDHDANLKLTMKMIKSNEDSTWNSRIYASKIDESIPMHVKLVVYALYDTQPGRFVGEVNDDQVPLKYVKRVCLLII